MKRTPTWMHTTGPSPPLLGLRLRAWRIVPAIQRRWRRLCQAAKVGGVNSCSPKFRLTRTCPWCLREWMAMILLQNCCWPTLNLPFRWWCWKWSRHFWQWCHYPRRTQLREERGGLEERPEKSGSSWIGTWRFAIITCEQDVDTLPFNKIQFLMISYVAIFVINVDWGIWPKIV